MTPSLLRSVPRHTGLVVEDMARQRAFYETALGFQVAAEAVEEGPFIAALLGIPECVVTTCKMLPTGGGAMLELLWFHNRSAGTTARPGPTTPGWTHLALTVADLAATHVALLEAGGSSLSGVLPAPNGQVLVAYVRDPEGNLLELVQETPRSA